MHPKAKQFLGLTALKTEKLNLLCLYLHEESELENDMVLNYLEFMDESNEMNELLILEIANELLGGKLSALKHDIVLLQYEIENIRQKLYELI